MEVTDALEFPRTQTRNMDLERRVVNYLVGRGVPALRQIEVHAEHGRVRLRGSVGSFYHKQLCLNCCRRVAGVFHVVDELDVESIGAGRPD